MKNVELTLNNLQMDLTGSESIAGSYSIADFGKLQTRKTNVSVEFQLPLTNRNKKNIENLQISNNASRIPYTVLSAKLTVNGINMNMDRAIIRRVDKKITLRLYGGNKNFFDLISPLKINECDLSEYDHDWIWSEMQTRLNVDAGNVYSLVNYGLLSNVANRVDCERLFQSVYTHSIVRAMIEDQGYSFAGNILDDPDFLLDIVPFSNSRTKYSDVFVENHNASFALSSDELNLVGVVTTPDYYKVSLDTIVSDPGSHISLDGTLLQLVYTPEKNYQAKFRVKLTMHDAEFLGVFNYRVKVFRDGDADPLAEWYGVTAAMDGGVYGVKFDQTSAYVSIDAGDKIYLEANIYSAGTMSNHHTLIVGGVDVSGNYISQMDVIVNDAGPSYGDFWESAANLPEISQPDFLKFVLQEYGCLIHVNEIKKIVTINKFTKVIQNKTIAKDWSEKVLTNETATEYELKDYSQTNHCRYLDDDAVVKPDGTDFDILIDNEILDPEQDLFIAPFAATMPVVRLQSQVNVEVVDLTGDYDKTYFDHDDDSGTADVLQIDYQRLRNVKPRILHNRPETSFVMHFYSGNAWKFSSSDFFRPYFIDINMSFNLGWQYLIPMYSQKFVDILQSYRIVMEKIRLNEIDINQLDHFIPVWIEKHYAYFFISLVDQFLFTQKSPTLVHLVKI